MENDFVFKTKKPARYHLFEVVTTGNGEWVKAGLAGGPGLAGTNQPERRWWSTKKYAHRQAGVDRARQGGLPGQAPTTTPPPTAPEGGFREGERGGLFWTSDAFGAEHLGEHQSLASPPTWGGGQ